MLLNVYKNEWRMVSKTNKNNVLIELITPVITFRSYTIQVVCNLHSHTILEWWVSE